MPNSTCSIDDCLRPSRARGLCRYHYLAWWRGKPDIIAAAPNFRRPPKMTPAETFRYFMPEDPPIEGCWTWRGNQNTLGYGMIDCSTGGRRHFRANRISYEIFVGPIPDGHVIRHTCDNPPCVQPDHLVPGTPLDNSRDMTSRRRQRSKLAEEQVLEIRALYAAGTSKPELGRRFAVATVTIDAIVRRRNWKHL